MVVAIIWFVKIKIAKLIFVGYVLAHGNHMDLHGKTTKISSLVFFQIMYSYNNII